LERGLAVLGGHFGGIVVLPVHGRAERRRFASWCRPAKAAARHWRLPRVNLEMMSGEATAEAEAVLRGAEALPLTSG